jgi:hypothetical protein
MNITTKKKKIDAESKLCVQQSAVPFSTLTSHIRNSYHFV